MTDLGTLTTVPGTHHSSKSGRHPLEAHPLSKDRVFSQLKQEKVERLKLGTAEMKLSKSVEFLDFGTRAGNPAFLTLVFNISWIRPCARLWFSGIPGQHTHGNSSVKRPHFSAGPFRKWPQVSLLAVAARLLLCSHAEDSWIE